MPSYSLNRSRRYAGRVAITIGDPFGIGPEVVLKALASRKLRGLANFLIIGDRSVLYSLPKFLNAAIRTNPHISIADLRLISEGAIRWGRRSALSGRASLAYIDYALKLIKDDQADCLVTAPVSKEAISRTGVEFSGHTEYIAKAFKTDKFAMMLMGGPLRVTLVTRHLPLKAVAKAITEEEISDCIELSHAALKRYFGINRPRIGVASLNPHGGEGGSIGKEEERVIKPAVARAKKRFKDITGPVSSEALFYEAFRGRLDCVIAMYHDQGLTPLKMVARDKSVNVTLGLPFVRTSPGHGTAFDIAGKGLANAESMIEAVNLAIEMHKKGGRS
ncbi:MAG: 4-hydroxythreonine-4-phosphate dehydrogenase PdxA [Candidatus Omnitrophota bacterium]|nr:4-hydroxythreonine-4-phosphate dehydrogenase PdxA [Candidatus Omnitrophota bacterium]